MGAFVDVIRLINTNLYYKGSIRMVIIGNWVTGPTSG